MILKKELDRAAQEVADVFGISPYQITQHSEAKGTLFYFIHSHYGFIPVETVANHFGVKEANYYRSVKIFEDRVKAERQNIERL